MSPSRSSPAARPSTPDTTPWPTFATSSASNVATTDSNDSTTTRRGNSPPRSSPRKMKPRPRQERAAEEDPRFNVGPKLPRAMLARRLMRRARPERVIDPYTMDVPDYPPPSFQEAISSSSPIPVSPASTVTLMLPLPQQAESNSHAADSDVPGDTQVNEQHSTTTFDSDSSSNNSMNDFVDVLRMREDDKGDESQQGLVFPSSPSRGRARSRGVLDDDPDDQLAQQPAASTRRHNSLSPLHTLFPSLHFTLHDRAATAHPTTEAPPTPTSSNSPARTVSFFRSTTSLGLFNPSGNTTPTLKTKPSTNNLSSPGASPKRRLFSQSKCKERERVERPERLEKVEIDPYDDKSDIWELIEAAEASGAELFTEPKSRKKKEKEKKEKRDAKRNSLMSVEIPIPEPFRGHVEATRVPAPAALTPVEPPATQHQLQQQIQIQQPQPQRQPATHPLSLLDRKMPVPFIERVPSRSPRATPPPRPTSPPSRAVQHHESPLPSPTKSLNGGPAAAAAAVRHRPMQAQKSHVYNMSPLAIQSWKAGEESPTVADVGLEDLQYQQRRLGPDVVVDPLKSALETPLPPSPSESVRAHATPNMGFSNEFQSVIAEIAGLQFTPSSESFTTAADTTVVGGNASGTETPSKKHYPGRPLPAAPGLAGVWLPNEPLYLTPPSNGEGKNANCPEGLLIDLDDNTFIRGGNTTQAARSQVDLRMPAASTATIPGCPVMGYGHGHCGHLAAASTSVPNLSQPIFSPAMHVVGMGPAQSQGNAAPHVWTPMCNYAPDARWICDCRVDHEHEPPKHWGRQQVPPSPKDMNMKNVSTSPYSFHPQHAHPCALALARAQTHPSASLSSSVCTAPPSLHVTGR